MFRFSDRKLEIDERVERRGCGFSLSCTFLLNAYTFAIDLEFSVSGISKFDKGSFSCIQ